MLKHRIDIKELEGMQDSMIKELRERDVQLSDIQSKLDSKPIASSIFDVIS